MRGKAESSRAFAFGGLLGTVAAIAAAGVGLAFAGTLAQRVEPEVKMSTEGMSATQQEKLDKMASASLFGQFRSSMADFLWLKVDKYLHSGVELRGLTPLEQEKQNADKVTSQGAWKHRGETTVIPSAERDWRGVFGNVEREVHPYKDMVNHSHRDPKEALPLFRLMTWSNPHFIAGYVVGSSMIAQEKSKTGEAITFLEEGLRNNPQNLEIETALGQMLTAKTKEYDKAVPHLIHALQIAGMRDHKTFTEDEEEAFQDSFRWLVLNRREAGDFASARKVAHEGLKFFPKDVVCNRFLKDYGE